jgi:hypothetical protein
MKRRYRNRGDNRGSSTRFTFHSYGTHFSFDPHRVIADDRIVNEANYFENLPQLEFYKNEVRAARHLGQKHVYILDSKGQEVRV